MIRKRTSKLLRLQPSHPDSPVSSRPPSRAVPPSPRTLVMSNADLWSSKPSERTSIYEPSIAQIDEESEPLFHDSFLSQSYEQQEPTFRDHLARFEMLKRSSQYGHREQYETYPEELEYDDVLGDLDDFDTDSICSEASVAISITVYNLGRPKLVDISPPASIADAESPYLHARQLSTSSRSSSSYSEHFSHHSASSSQSDCTRPSQPATPASPTERSSRRSSLFKPDIPPRSHSKKFTSSKVTHFALDEPSHDLYAEDCSMAWRFPIPGAYRE